MVDHHATHASARPGGAATSIVLMVRGMGGAMFNVACSAAFTFGDVKQRIHERGGPLPSLQVLLWGGFEVDDFQCVSEVEQRREPLILAVQAPRGLPPTMPNHSPVSPSATMTVRSAADLSLAICGPKGCGKSAILSYLVGHVSGTRTPQRHLVIAAQDFDVEVSECPRIMLAPGTTGFAQRLARSTAVMMVFDISNAKSFDELQRYYDTIPRVPPLVLVGNKIDEETDYILRWEQRTHFPLFSSLERYLESLLADTSLMVHSSCITHADAILPPPSLLPPSAVAAAAARPIAVPSTAAISHMASSPISTTMSMMLLAASDSPGAAAAFLSSSPHTGTIHTNHTVTTSTTAPTPITTTLATSSGSITGVGNGHHIGSAPLTTSFSSSPALSSAPIHHAVSSHATHSSHARVNSTGMINVSPPATMTRTALGAPTALYCLPQFIIGLILDYFLMPSPMVGGREVTREEAMTLARRWRCPYVEISCKTQLGVRSALTLLLAQAMVAGGHAISSSQIAQSLPSQLAGAAHNNNNNGNHHNIPLMLNSGSGHTIGSSSPLLTSGHPVPIGSPGHGPSSHLSVSIPNDSGFSPLPSPHYMGNGNNGSNGNMSMMGSSNNTPTSSMTVTSRADARPVAPKVPKKVMWVPDSKTNECMRCKAAFHVFLRRHHCRLCGLIFCYACSEHRVNGSRVCDFCYR